MPAEVCALHSETAASFRCDGCGRLLCQECVKEGHALLFCSICGERALPLRTGQPVTTREREREEAIRRPYSLREGLLYPFRGLGLFLFVSTIFAFGVVRFMAAWSCLGFLFFLALFALMVTLQFKIVRSTAEGDNELPDWPEYFGLTERLADLLTYLFIGCLNVAPVALFVVAVGIPGLSTMEPSLLFWTGFAICLWVGTAMMLLAYGAAGTYGLAAALRVIVHVRAFRAAGADAVTVTNLVFVMQALIFVLRAVLVGTVPFLGAVLAGTMGIYWFFTGPHLAGVLFRRHRPILDALYES
jgi:ANCHR-like B-box zinc-binding domain